jgi:hypothetical protein
MRGLINANVTSCDYTYADVEQQRASSVNAEHGSVSCPNEPEEK